MSLIHKFRNSFILACIVSLSFALIPVAPALADVPTGGQMTLTTTNNLTGITTNPTGSVYNIATDLTTKDQLTSLMVEVTDTDGDLKPDNVPVYEDGDLNSIGNLEFQQGSSWLFVPDPGENISFVFGSHSLTTTTFQYYNFNPTPLTLTFNYTVVKVDQTITFGPISDATYKSPITLSATASSGLPITYTVLSGGTGTASIVGNVLTPNSVGTVTVEATQAGNGIYLAATPVDQVLNIIPGTPTINLASVTNVTYDGTPKAVTVTMTHGTGAIVVTYNGSGTPPTAIGTYTVVASNAGDSNHNPSTASGVLNILSVNSSFITDSIKVITPLTLSNNTPAIGETVTASVTVKNISTSSITLQYLGIVNYFNSPSDYARNYGGGPVTLAAGESRTLTYSRILPDLGNFKAWVSLEYNNQWLTASNAANQPAVVSYVTHVPKMQIVGYVDLSTANPTVGQAVTATASVRNLEPNAISLDYIGIVNQWNPPSQYYQNYGGEAMVINPGEAKLLQYTTTMVTPGNYRTWIAYAAGNYWFSIDNSFKGYTVK
jgi:hypothetical protein